MNNFTMNGAMGMNDAATHTVVVKTEPDEWSREDDLTLLERIKSCLPENDILKYKTMESHFDWEKVSFSCYTGEMCRQEWQKVSMEVRKYRTMTELIADAMEFVKNPYKGKKLKTHPDFPKKPLTPYFRFFMEKRAKYAKIHPEMSNLDLTKILSKKYKELPEKKKMKYIQEFQREKEEFEKLMARFREDHPELMEERKKSDLPEKPKTPQQLWYNHEKKAFLKLHPDVSPKEMKEALRRQWSQLSDKKRLKWISKALELQKDYEVSLRAYLDAHPESNHEETVKSVLTKAERQLKDKFDGRPTKPPPNGYSMYCAELMVNMKDVPSTERMVLCSKQWKMMSQKEKDMYQKRCEQKKKQYETDLHRFLESLPSEEKERVLMEEKLGNSRLAAPVQTSSPPRAKSPSVKRELTEMRAPSSAQTQKKTKFSGEPKKPPMSGYQMFSQELLTNGELNHFSLKERMVEIGKRWHKLSQSQKDRYKKMVEEQQIEYKTELEAWLKALSPQERAMYKEFISAKRRNSSKPAGPPAKVKVAEKDKADTSESEDDDEEKSDSSDSDEEDSSASSDSDDEEDDEEEEDDDNEEEEEEEEDQSDGSSSSSMEDSSDSDSD